MMKTVCLFIVHQQAPDNNKNKTVGVTDKRRGILSSSIFLSPASLRDKTAQKKNNKLYIFFLTVPSSSYYS